MNVRNPSVEDFKGMGLAHHTYTRPHPDGMGDVIVVEYCIPNGFSAARGVKYMPVGYIVCHGRKEIFGSKESLRTWEEVKDFLDGKVVSKEGEE